MTTEEMERKLIELWMLLDDIDTVDGRVKGNHLAYRHYSYRLQQKRFDILSHEEVGALLEKHPDLLG